MSLRIVCAVLGAASLAPAVDGADLRFGVAAFGAVDPLRDVKTVAGCGYDYIEPALFKAVALSEALAAARRDVQASGIRVETMNWFLPGSDIKLTGPAVDRDQVRAYLEKSLALAAGAPLAPRGCKNRERSGIHSRVARGVWGVRR